jgi:hypothetical protein
MTSCEDDRRLGYPSNGRLFASKFSKNAAHSSDIDGQVLWARSSLILLPAHESLDASHPRNAVWGERLCWPD